MKYWFHDVGIVDSGNVLEITLDYAAHVRIMDFENYHEYKNRRPYKSISKYITTSPFSIKVPRSSHWFVVVDLEGIPGSVFSEVRVRRAGARPKADTIELPEHGGG